jgi:hypothetical protein
MCSHLRSLSFLLLSLLQIHAYDVVECYWAANQQLPGDPATSTNAYIPCGEVSLGAQSCCRVGHTCLEANACYAPDRQASPSILSKSFLAD